MIAKRVLFIATTNLNWNDGGAYGQRGYLASIRRLSNNLTDVIMPEEGCYGQYADAIGVPQRPFYKSILSGSIHRYKDFLRQHLERHKNEYDVCFIFGGIYAGDMMDMIHSYGIKIVVTHLNYEPEYQMDNKTMWTFYGRTPFFVIRNERNAYLKADVNCFMSNDDQKLFESHYGKIATPAVMIGCYEYENKALVEENNAANNDFVMAITGSMNTVQTISGIMDFKDKYYKIFKEMCPDWKIVIAGRNPSEDIYKFAEQSNGTIDVIANPDNMKTIILSSSIFYCPTNAGGGIKLRLMDGLKQGRPVLVHKVSARGYESLFNEPFFKVYNNEDTFQSGLRDILNYVKNNFNSQQIARKYLEYFSLEAGTERYKKVFNILNSNNE